MRTVLEVRDLSKHFGGISAVEGVSFEVREGEILGIIGPERLAASRRCSTASSASCSPRRGEVRVDGQPITGMRPSDLNRLGIGRTFQLLQVFPQLTVRENLILAGQEHQGSMLVAAVRAARCGAHRRREQMIDFFRLAHRGRSSRPADSPTASRSCSTPRWPSWPARASCCSTSRPAA